MRIGDCNRNESEGEDHKAASRQKKLKAKTLKWRSSNSDMNDMVKAGGSDGVYDDTVLCSLTTASFSSLISRKRVKTLGKVAEHCDAIDPPVPRKLRSAINKRVGRIVSGSPRHVKKRRHLSAISAQVSFVDQETRFNESSQLFTEDEEVVAGALLSLSQIPCICELTADKAVADSSNINVASTSYSEVGTKEGDKIIMLPSSANELANQAACIDKPVGRTGSGPPVNPVLGATDQPNNINPPLSENEQIHDLSLGTVANLPNPSKDSSNNSARKQLKVQFSDSQSYPAQKPEDPLWLINSDSMVHETEKAKNNSAQEIVPLAQTPLPCTPDGYLIKHSSGKLASLTNKISEFSKVTASGNRDKISRVKNGSPTKAWKKSITHVYVSHVIQMHLNKEKASQNRPQPEERSHILTSRSPNWSTLHKNNAQDETFYATHYDARLPVQPSTGIRDMGAGRQKMVSGNSMNLPASSALPAAQHVQYLHTQIVPRGAMPYQFQHFPYSRGNVAHTAALEQMQQYMCSPGYVLRPGFPASSSAMTVKLQQLIPTQQQQQQMWQLHVSPRPDATPPSSAAWHNVSSLRPIMSMLPPPPPPQTELFCAPYQGGGSRQPQQLRLI